MPANALYRFTLLDILQKRRDEHELMLKASRQAVVTTREQIVQARRLLERSADRQDLNDEPLVP